MYWSEDGSHYEYEMYNLIKDPGQINNLLFKDIKTEDEIVARRPHVKLKEHIDHSKVLPEGFIWPKKSTLRRMKSIGRSNLLRPLKIFYRPRFTLIF